NGDACSRQKHSNKFESKNLSFGGSHEEKEIDQRGCNESTEKDSLNNILSPSIYIYLVRTEKPLRCSSFSFCVSVPQASYEISRKNGLWEKKLCFAQKTEG